MLNSVQKAGGDVLSFDWKIPIDSARALLGKDQPVQGNLDPVILFAPLPVIRSGVHDVLKRAGARGHIFNLGHGILQHTPVEHVKAVVEMVHEYQHE